VQVKAAWQFDGLSADQRRRWTEHARVTIDRQGTLVQIRDVVPDELLALLAGGSHPRLEMEIRVPSGVGLEATTSFGDAEVMGELGDVTVRSNIGNLALRQLRCSGRRVEAHTQVGDVLMTLQSLPREQLQAKVGIGDARIQLPAGASANIALTAEIGRVTSGRALASGQRAGSLLGGSLSGTLNEGDTAVRVDVATGDIRLE
jgi:hypothetical protein